MHRFSDQIIDKAKPLPPYWATTFDAALIVHAPAAALKGNDMIFNGSAACMFGGMALLDLPLAVFTDTLCLPYDGYHYSRYDKDVAFWDVFFAGTNASSSQAYNRHLTRYTGPWVRKRLPAAPLTEHQVTSLMDIRYLYYALAQRPDLTEAEAMRLLTEAQGAPQSLDAYCIKRNLAMNGHAPSIVVLKLSEDADRGLVWAAAANPQLPLSRIIQLSSSSQAELLRELAHNSSASGEVFRELVASASKFTDPHAKYTIREAVAANPNTPADLLMELSNDHAMLKTLIRNPSTPAAALKNIVEGGVLKDDPLLLVRTLNHPNCPVDSIRIVNQKGALPLRLFLGVTNAPPDVLHAMAVTCQKERYSETMRMDFSHILTPTLTH